MIEDLECEVTPCWDGVKKVYRFANGYGASVIRHQYSYGGDVGLWEVGVLGVNGKLCYSTPITEDVIGYLCEDEVRVVLRDIAALPAAE